MKQITVISGQTTADLALQYYGAIEGIFLLIDDNPDIFTLANLHQPPAGGTQIQIISAPIHADVVQYYQNNQIVPGSTANSQNSGSFNNSFNNSFQ